MPAKSSPPPRPAVVLNPGAGSMGEMEGITAALREALPTAEIRVSRAPGDAEATAQELRRAGFDCVIAAGGAFRSLPSRP